MSDQELLEFNQAVKRLQDERTASGATPFAFLVQEGIVDEAGELTEPYL